MDKITTNEMRPGGWDAMLDAQEIGQLKRQLDAEREKAAKWERVFGHLGTADECGNEWFAMGDKLAAAQARIQELTEFIKARIPHLNEGPECTYCNLFLGNDDLSALESAKAQARREALLEVLSGLEDGTDWHDVADVAAWVRRMAREVK